jgi:hypothetical protein
MIPAMGRRIAIAAAVIVALLALGGAWVWHQIFALPDWYTDGEAAALQVPTDPDAPPQWIALGEDDEPLPDEQQPAFEALDEAQGVPPLQEPAGADAQPPVEAEPAPAKRKKTRRKAKAHELRGFHHQSRAKAGKTAVKASRARYEDGRLEAGVIMDLSKVPRERLSAKDRALYERAVDNFPGLTKRDVYVGIEDRPVERDGFLQLGPEPKVRVGNLRYSLSSAAAKLGFTPERLRGELDRELRRLGMKAPE